MNRAVAAIAAATLGLSGCLFSMAGAAAGGGLGYAADSNSSNPAVGMGVGAGIGLAVGSIIGLFVCMETPGAATMSSSGYSSKPWYCEGP